jgi:hypothetical protein
MRAEEVGEQRALASRREHASGRRVDAKGPPLAALRKRIVLFAGAHKRTREEDAETFESSTAERRGANASDVANKNKNKE